MVTLKYLHDKLKSLAYRNPDLVIANGFNLRVSHPSSDEHTFITAPASVKEMLKIVNHLLEYPCNLLSEVMVGTNDVGFKTLMTDVVDAWGKNTETKAGFEAETKQAVDDFMECDDFME